MTAETTGDVLKRLAGLHPRSIDLSLSRIERLLEALGRPQDRLPRVVHVAGTNGKGSVCAFLKAMCESAGERVHLYTSPHLVRFNERIELGGQPVDDERLFDALVRIEKANQGLPLTFFEATTAAAILLMAEDPADRVILEVGLGGKWDATNVIAHPDLTIITPVSLDHQDYLGDSLSGIAKEKAGILKTGSPAIIGPQDDEAMRAIQHAILSLDISDTQHDRDWRCWGEQGRMVYEEDSLVWDLPMPGLPGAHQIDNAGIAIAAARQIGLSEEAVRRGVTHVRWPARLQRLTKGPLAEMAEGAGAELWLRRPGRRSFGWMAGTTPPPGPCSPGPWLISRPATPSPWCWCAGSRSRRMRAGICSTFPASRAKRSPSSFTAAASRPGRSRICAP